MSGGVASINSGRSCNSGREEEEDIGEGKTIVKVEYQLNQGVPMS